MSDRQTLTDKPRAPTAPSRVVQRCACGGKKGPSGECAECRRKRLARKRVQPKLTIGAPDDRFEREADRIADAVMRAPADAAPLTAPVRVQRIGAGPEAGGAGMEAPASVDAVLASPGRPLDAGTRQFMEARMGHDFSRVRVHTDARAAASTREVSARAFTVGQNVAFGAEEYKPGTTEGRRLLAHELVHTLQQSRGDGSPFNVGRTLMRQTVAGGEQSGSDPFDCARLLRIRGVTSCGPSGYSVRPDVAICFDGLCPGHPEYYAEDHPDYASPTAGVEPFFRRYCWSRRTCSGKILTRRVHCHNCRNASGKALSDDKSGGGCEVC